MSDPDAEAEAGAIALSLIAIGFIIICCCVYNFTGSAVIGWTVFGSGLLLGGAALFTLLCLTSKK